MTYFTANLSVPSEATRNSYFLVPATFFSTDGWVLVQGGFGGEGVVRVRLVDEYGSGLSDFAEVYGNGVSRVKLLNVKVAPSGDGFPRQLRLEAQNKSRSGSDARVHGLLLL
jgi:hypothetical protein